MKCHPNRMYTEQSFGLQHGFSLYHTQTASPVVPPAPVCQLIRRKQLCLIIRHAVEDVEECVLQAGQKGSGVNPAWI